MRETELTNQARVIGVEDNGTFVHVELDIHDGGTIVGVYELIGWTTPPNNVKMQVEKEIWVSAEIPKKESR